jgi:superfamily II DNA or RNA helicase
MLPVDPHRDVAPLLKVLRESTLRTYQAQGAVRIAMEEGHILQYDTGKGKTHTAIGGVQLRFNKRDVQKVLWLCPLAVVSKTKQLFDSETYLRSGSVRGIEGSVERFVKKDLEVCDLVIINFEAFDNKEVLSLVRDFQLANFFDMVVVDEAHLIADPFGSDRNAFIWFTAYRMKIKVLLTATVLVSRVEQYASLLALITGNLTGLFSLMQAIHNGDYQEGKAPNLSSFSRRDDKVPSYVVRFEDSTKVDSAPGVTIFKSTRGEQASAANGVLLKLIREKGSERFLVHCLLTSMHKFLKDLLERELGIKVGIVSGSARDREGTCKAFSEGHLQCLVFSISTGLDMQADYTIMYDWNVYAAQAIGRGLRTEEVGDYEVYFLLSTHKKEESLFLNSVDKNNALMKKATGTYPININY